MAEHSKASTTPAATIPWQQVSAELARQSEIAANSANEAVRTLQAHWLKATAEVLRGLLAVVENQIKLTEPQSGEGKTPEKIQVQ